MDIVIERRIAESTKAWAAAPLFILLLIDVVNGVWTLATSDAFTMIALAIKMMILLYMALRCRWRLAALTELAVLVLVICWSSLVLENNADSLILILKTAAVIALYIVLDSYSYKLPEAAMVSFLRFSLITIAASLVLGLLGIGHERYGESEGTGLQANGFLTAGNEINIALVGLFWWLASARKYFKANRLDQALYWLCLALMIVSQSKTTIIAAAIIALLYQPNRKASIALLMMCVVPVLVYLLLSSEIWERWVFFYNAYAREGVLSALTNGRFGRLDYFSFVASDLFSRGLSVLASGGGYIESDPLDLLFNFGAFGILLYILFAKRLWSISGPSVLPSCLVIFASCLAGHVIYSVFAAPLLFCSFRMARLYRLRCHK